MSAAASILHQEPAICWLWGPPTASPAKRLAHFESRVTKKNRACNHLAHLQVLQNLQAVMGDLSASTMNSRPLCWAVGYFGHILRYEV
mmetsp:Transcript_73138/g.126899  ORF Transcript_73138/g.126899 Transcript_73138/m.126899 type:complete len:88 (-) Transcript_73138:925-1188(-)